MKYLTIPLAVFLLMMTASVANAQVQGPGYQCTQCPTGQQPQYVFPTPPANGGPTYVPVQPQPQQPVLAAQPSLTIENMTQAISAALDPINKHLGVIDAQIVNITGVISKLQTTTTNPPPLPPPSYNNQTLPPPPPPGQGQQGQQGSSSSCPNGGGPGPGPGYGPGLGGPINQYFYPGPGGFSFGHHGGRH